MKDKEYEPDKDNLLYLYSNALISLWILILCCIGALYIGFYFHSLTLKVTSGTILCLFVIWGVSIFQKRKRVFNDLYGKYYDELDEEENEEE